MIRTSGFVALLCAVLLASDMRPSAGQSVGTPQFGATTELIRLDVSVLDRSRLPVKGLQASDFALTEDGKAQPITAFSEVTLRTESTDLPSWASEVVPDVRVNDRPSEHRLVVILLDDALIPAQPDMVNSAKDIARDVVRQLGANDRAAVVFSKDSRAAQNFTSEKARLIASIETFGGGQADPSLLLSGEPGIRAIEKARSLGLTRTLRLLVDALGSVPERRKAVVCICVGAPVDVESTAVGGNPLDPAVQVYGEMKELTRLALRANVSIYSVDPGGLDGIRLAIERGTRTISYAAEMKRLLEEAEIMTRAYHDFNRVVSDNTGGRAFLNTNEFKTAVSQILRETGSYYLLGYSPANTKADGRFRKIQVKVNKPGLNVTARRGYYAPDATKPAPASPNLTAIAGILPKNELFLQAGAAQFRVAGEREASVIVLLGLKAPSGSRGATDKVNVVIKAYDTEGRERAAQTLSADVKFSASEGQGDVDYEIASRLRLAPGRYELRMSAESTLAGRSGGIFYDLTVPDFQSKPLELSTPVVSIEPRVPMAAGDALTSVPHPPTTRRVFLKSDQVRIFLPAYQVGADTVDAVALTTEILNRRGERLETAVGTLGSMETTGVDNSNGLF